MEKNQASFPVFATVFGLGLLRPAPGTWGSLPPVLLAGAVYVINPAGSGWINLIMGIMLVVSSVACVLDAARAEAFFGKKDPGQVVADETAGQSLVLLFLPPAAFQSDGNAIVTLCAAFILFRAFDIFKPWPVHQLQSLPRGWGVLIDDLAAGVYAAIPLQILWRVVL